MNKRSLFFASVVAVMSAVSGVSAEAGNVKKQMIPAPMLQDLCSVMTSLDFPEKRNEFGDYFACMGYVMGMMDNWSAREGGNSMCLEQIKDGNQAVLDVVKDFRKVAADDPRHVSEIFGDILRERFPCP